jgi:two-component system response regulator FixJ
MPLLPAILSARQALRSSLIYVGFNLLIYVAIRSSDLASTSAAEGLRSMTDENGGNNVYIVDDDRHVRLSLSFQLSTLDYQAAPYASADDFLAATHYLSPGCILLDIRMAGTDGIEALHELARLELDWPVIMMTGHAEVPLAVAAMKGGAIELLEKPFEEDLLLAALDRGFAKLAAAREHESGSKAAKAKLALLSVREREVLQHLVSGEANKRVAAALGLSVRTIEMHRAKGMRKLGVKSIAEVAAYSTAL